MTGKTIRVTRKQADAAMPEWIKNDTQALRELYHSCLDKRMDMFRAEDDETAQDILRDFAREWHISINTITLAEAERRWNKANLRQKDVVHKWKSAGTWLTTTFIMESVYGPEPDSG